MSSSTTFIEQCLAGDVDAAEIDDFVERWHDSDTAHELHDFLGMTWREYQLWAERSESLSFILASRKYNVPVESLHAYSEQTIAAAARAGSPEEAKRVLDWLHQTRRV